MSIYPKMIVTPPGPKSKKVLKRGDFLLSPSISHPFPLVVDSGKGCFIQDIDGNEYIDFNASSCVMNLGYDHPRVLKAINRQSQKLIHHTCSTFCDLALELAENLHKIIPGTFKKKSLFTTSGTEAIEAGIKLVKWNTRKHRFLTFSGAFHGTTLGAISLSGESLPQFKYFFPMISGVIHAPNPYCYRCPFRLEFPTCNYWCVNFIEENIIRKYLPYEELGALIFEPIQWMGGCIVPPPDYFKRLKKLADKYNFLLIDDELFTGMGRIKRWFGIENWEIEADIVCVGGALASGLPLGAIIAKADVMDWEPNSHSNVFGGNLLAYNVALAVIETLKKERLIENGTRMGNYLLSRLKEMKETYPIIGDVRGKGLMIGIELVKDQNTKQEHLTAAKRIVIECWKRGLIIHKNGRATLLLSPPLSITKDVLDKGLELIEESIAEVEQLK